MKTDIQVAGEAFIPLSQYPCVYEQDSLRTCVDRFLERGSDDGRHLFYDELLVMDLENEIIGSIRYIDILKTLFPSLRAAEKSHVFSGKTPRFGDLSVLLEGNFAKKCHHQLTLHAGECMTLAPSSVSADTHLLHALEIMVSAGHTRLIVTVDRVPAGILRMSDVFKHLSSYCMVQTSEGKGSAPAR